VVCLGLRVDKSPLHSMTSGQKRVKAFQEGRSESSGFFWFFVGQGFSPAESPLSPPFHPHSSLSDFVRSVQVGFSRSSRCCHLIVDLPSILRMEAGPGHRRSHRNSALGLLPFLPPRCFAFMLGKSRLFRMQSPQPQCQDMAPKQHRAAMLPFRLVLRCPEARWICEPPIQA